MKNHVRKKKIFIEALEQRIMLDGAGASTFLDLIDDRNQDKFLQKNSKKLTKFSENKVDDKSKIVPFDQAVRDQKRNERKQVVFIDSQVQDYQKLINSFNEDTEVYLIQSNEDGFKKIDSALKDNCDISSLHIIGHGSAGKILFGNATLSNDTIQSYNQTLRSIGQCLTEDGDILFYGCNVASTDGGKTLISKISEVTKADIAASDDVTGKGGDWDLEKKIGIVETQNVKVVDYKHYLANGVASVSGYMEEGHAADNFNTQDVGSGGYQSSGTGYFVVTRERANASNGTITLDKDDDGNSNVSLNTDTYPVDVYLVFMNDTENDKIDRVNQIGSITFDNEIYGIMWDDADTVAMSGFDKSGATYPTSYSQRGYENEAFHANNDVTSGGPSGDDDVDKETDWVSVSSNQRTLRTGVKNGTPGDYMRVFVAAANNAPVAANNTGIVNEDATLTVADGASANSITTAAASHDSSPYSVSSQETKPRDVEFNRDGTKMFILGATGDDVNEYTLSTGWDVSTASFVDAFSISGQETEPTGLSFNNDGTKMYVNGWAGDDVNEYTLSTAFDVSTAEYVDVTGIGGNDERDIEWNSDGTKMYIMNRANERLYQYTLGTAFDVSTYSYDGDYLDVSSQETAANSISFNADGTRLFVMGEAGDDVNEYTLSTAFDVTSTVTHKGSFSISSQETDPQGLEFNHDGTKMFVTGESGDDVNEYSLTSPYNLIDVTGEHDGDVLGDDTDADDDSLTVASVRTGAVEGSGSAGTVGSALTGTYGQLTLNANGSYTYVANQSAADDLDAGDVVTDSFNYTVSDGTDTDTATIVITVIGINDDPVGVNDTDSVNEDATITQSSGSSLLMADDTDADDHDSKEITVIQPSGGSASSVSQGSSYNSSGTSVTGTYGTLTVGADGTYTYVADQSAADDLDASDTVTDVFTYTVWDGAATDTATLTITVTGVNDAPVAQNDVGYIQEGKTLTVSNGANANVSGSYDATGEHSGDVINTSSGSHSDSDADDSASLSVASFRTGGSEGSGTAGTLGEALSGTYGTLTMNANGSYTYVSTANSVSGTVTDVFNYTVSDGTATDTATLTITIYNSNNPVAANNTGTINEDATLSVSNGASANNITTAALSTGTPLDISDEETVATGLKFNPDGTKMFIVGINGIEINEYTLSTAWDVSSATHDRALSISAKDTRPQGVTFNSDGTKIYVVGRINDNIDSWELSTPYSLAGVDATDDHIATTDLGSNFNPRDIKFNNDGSKMFVLDTDGDTVAEYSLSTAYDPASKGSATEQSVSDAGSWLQGMGFNADGTRMFLVSSDDDDIHEFKLSTAWDISSETYVGNYAVTYPGSYNITAMAFSHDGTKMFHNDYSQGEVEQHTLVSPFNLVENVTGEHDGDVLGDDTDADSDTLTVASFRTGGTEGSGTAGTLGAALTGTYGQLTLNANGSYTYVANQSAADDLDAGDVVTDSFNYTVSDSNGGTDIATIVITVVGVNDAPVAVDDTDSVDANETTTATNGSSNDLLTDDTDADDHDSKEITVIQPSGGSASDVSTGSSYNSSGTEVTGTYGTLTIGADGSYTYVADQDAADNIDGGSSETDVFTYTFWDGAATDTGTITITVSGEDATTTETEEPKKEKKEAKKEKKELKKQRKKIKRAKRLLLKEFKLPKSSISRSAEFNQGLKLVDLVAESGSIDFKQGKEDISKLNAKFTDKSLKVKFKVFNDEGKEVQKYYGEMKDGSPLPEWIKIDPKTGKTKTNIPKGEKLVEFKIIAVDTDNNKKQVTVVIDPEKIAKDKEILKEVRKTAKAKIMINKDGSIKLKSINKDGSVNKTTTDAINENKNFEDVVKKIKPNEFLKLEPNLRNNDFVVELPDEIKTNFKSLRVVLKDGKEIPNWIKLNPISGEIIANPPENVEKVELKVIIENENGEVTVKDIEINFSDVNPETTEKLLDNDIKFMPLSDQLLKEQTILDNYGSQIINNL